MPMIDADGCLLNVSTDGRGDGPTLMLSNSLGCTLEMWEPQMNALTREFHVIRYDRRGHGKLLSAAWPLLDGTVWPGRVGHPRRSQHREDALVRPVDGWHGRTVARSQCAGAFRQGDNPRRGSYFECRATGRFHGCCGRLPDTTLNLFRLCDTSQEAVINWISLSLRSRNDGRRH
jgi:hypothetical protein